MTAHNREWLEKEAQEHADKLWGYTSATRMRCKEWHRAVEAYQDGALMAFEIAADKLEQDAEAMKMFNVLGFTPEGKTVVHPKALEIIEWLFMCASSIRKLGKD